MKQTSGTASTRTGNSGSAARTLGTLTMAAGASIAVGVVVSVVTEWGLLALLLGLALLAYVLPQLHLVQSPADGWPGRYGALLAAAGAGVIVALGAFFLVWEAVGTPGEPAWAGVAWLVGFLAFLVGTVLFAVGSAMARMFPTGAPVLVLVGLVAAVAIDMMTGAFFADDGSIPEWGFYLGVPVFGLGLIWMGWALRTSALRSSSVPDRGPIAG
ncbi:MAG: hypothetical protein ACLGI3_17995 [Actinomycetes bacterium]